MFKDSIINSEKISNHEHFAHSVASATFDNEIIDHCL
jgi:hypothetical protein